MAKRSSKSRKTSNKKPWTVMVYMAGDNNLDPNSIRDLKEMKKVGSTDGVHVVVQLDRASGAKRYYVKKGGKISGDVKQNLGTTNTGDPKTLIAFVKWTVQKYPAHRYALVLWNHGQGWDDTDVYADEREKKELRVAGLKKRHAFFRTTPHKVVAQAKAVGGRNRSVQKAILLDDGALDFIDNQELQEVLRATKKAIKNRVDILGMDACLMSMVEVGYQMRGDASYTVGSEQTEPLDGWPYNTILAALAEHPEMQARDVATRIVQSYLASYSADSVTQSACDLAKVDGLATAVRDLADSLRGALGDPALQTQILLARTRTQEYDVRDNVDLVDFCQRLAQAVNGTALAQRCRTVVQAVSPYVVKEGFKGADLRGSHGVAIYFPTGKVSPLYPKLDFAKDTGWHLFLNEYVKAVKEN